MPVLSRKTPCQTSLRDSQTDRGSSVSRLNFEWRQVCEIWPEAYDIRLNGISVGYFHLRHGVWACHFIGLGGELLADGKNFKGDGSFENDAERQAVFRQCEQALLDFLDVALKAWTGHNLDKSTL